MGAVKLALGVLGGLAVAGAICVIGQGLSTLDRLAFVERERDGWQRAPEIVAQLDLHPGSRVIDLGCGAGYFALKLAAAVEPSGSVEAVDILRLPLAFLWLRSPRTVHEVLGEPDDPRVEGPVDAVLIANTYHELDHPDVVVGRLSRALKNGGRMVIADRGAGDHSIPSDLVSAQLQREGFIILNRDDHFTTQPGEGTWWLITARKASL